MHSKPPAPPVQPVPYSHSLHLGLECAECQVQPDAAPQMTFPDNDTCMSCHATQPATSDVSKRLATLAGTGTPIPWARVYQLPDYVYWPVTGDALMAFALPR